MAKNIDAALKGKRPTEIKDPPVEVFACSLGRSRATGRLGSVKLFSFVFWFAKGRTLGMQMLSGYIDGSVA